MQISIAPFSLFLFVYTVLAAPQNATLYQVNDAKMQSIIYPPSASATAGSQDSESIFDISVQGVNSGALPVLCSLDVQNPAGQKPPSSSSPQVIPFHCNDTAVSVWWSRTNVTSLNGILTVQLAGAHPAGWILQDWECRTSTNVVSGAVVSTWTFTGPTLI